MTAAAGLCYVEIPAPAPAAPWLHCVWFLTGPLDGAPQTVVPDGRAEVIFHYGDPFRRTDGDGVSRAQAPSLVSGQLTGPLHLVPGAYADIAGIRFRSAAAGAVFSMPLNSITGHVGPLPDARRLLAPLRDAARPGAPPAERARRIAASIASLARSRPDPVVEYATRLLARPGGADIAAIAHSAGMSTRTLERRVRTQVGLSPVALRRVLRFRHAFQLLSASRPGGWTRIAHDAGYHDQAHLIRDFRAFAGVSPSAFFDTDPHLSRALLGDA